ncbi:hypothetical protein [Sphingobium chungbukense]|uniref:GH16 domain-containing protein n=1 Tax=Sphingobium chungbukense TaxID=56193 RepID=A0A0M3AS49_9SPHN|nr:hypothetical protein [Sphingobium chungbukense]KKW92680.1 hypothetical protein YP76_07030 [Sphingobium chungbukense]
MAVTRLSTGLSTRKTTDPLGQYFRPDPTDAHQFMDDFDFFGATNWTTTLIGTGTVALTAGDGGILLFTTTGASGDAVSTQKTTEGFSFETGKPAWFKVRFKVSALTTVVTVGLQVTDTTPEDATDGIFFQTTTATGAITGYVRKNATTGSTSAAVGTIVADTYTELGWYWDGKDTVTFYQDGVAKASVTGVAASYLPDTTTTPSFSVRTTTAAAKTASVDYIFASKSRR